MGLVVEVLRQQVQEMCSLAAEQQNSTTGAFDLGQGLTPVDIWQSLHASEPLWVASAGAEGGAENQQRIDETDLSLLRRLEEFPAKRWAQMCDGIGWTPLGAIGLSWCLGATEQAFRVAWSIAAPEDELNDRLSRALRLMKKA